MVCIVMGIFNCASTSFQALKSIDLMEELELQEMGKLLKGKFTS